MRIGGWIRVWHMYIYYYLYFIYIFNSLGRYIYRGIVWMGWVGSGIISHNFHNLVSHYVS